jgi:hypothetical protein
MKYAVCDLSAAIASDALSAYAAAQQRQLREHYASVFDGDGIDDEVRVAAAEDVPAADEILICLEPTAPSDEQGAIGFHGLGVIHVFLDIAAQAGVSWQSVASHEVLEARADPRLHACVELDDGTIWDREICDRVEADSYQIDGVELSNFNTPECFEPTPGVVEKYDWLGLSTQPNEVRPGGYAQEYTPDQGWTQVGQMRPYRQKLSDLGLSRGAKRRARKA